MKQPKATKPARFFSALIRTAYLPVELPPAITTRYFAEFCQNDFVFLKSQHPLLLKTTTNYETFTAPRPKSGRRNLALVHPLAQAGLSLSITQHRKKIKDLIARSGSSLYQTTEDLKNSYAFIGLDFSMRNALQAKVLSECPFVLNADISRYFYTIYTHSIPWAAIRHGHDFEVAWSLVVCGVLKIKLSKDDLDGGAPVPTPTILALIGLLHEKKLLTTSLSNWPWRATLKKAGIFDQYWLPFYEAVRRGWTNDKALIRQVKANPVLARMLDSNVTFLEDRIFEAAQINISARIFRSRGARIRTVKSIADYRALKQRSGPRGFGNIKLTIADLDY